MKKYLDTCNKKYIARFIIAIMLLCSTTAYAGAKLNEWRSKDGSVINEAGYPVYVNGEQMDMHDDITGKEQTVLNLDGRTYVPLRKIAEATNADPDKMWNNGEVHIITPEHSEPTDFVQVNMFPNGVPTRQAIQSHRALNGAAKDITKPWDTKRDKAYAIYNWVIEHMEYVWIDNNYDGMPDSDSVGALPAFRTGEGICYDYASLYAVLCDEAGLNARIVLGYAQLYGEGGYHAWNEVQLDNGQWATIDPTWGDGGDLDNYFDFQTSELGIDDYEIPDGHYPLQLAVEFENY